MEVVEYAHISKNATTGFSPAPLENFIGKNCRVMEFARDGGVLVVSPDGQAIATFDKCDIYRKFECRLIGEYILPPDLEHTEQIVYMGRVATRKGGYNRFLREMVIETSLAKGKFYDHFLWAKQ